MAIPEYRDTVVTAVSLDTVVAEQAGIADTAEAQAIAVSVIVELWT